MSAATWRQFSLARPIRFACSPCCYRRSYASTSLALSTPIAGPSSEHAQPKRKPRSPKKSSSPPRQRKTSSIEPWMLDKLLQPTKVETYLASLSSKASVTLADIERYCPPNHADPGSPQYEEQYIALVNTLMASFTSKQLRKFTVMYNLPRPLTSSSLPKIDYAVAIIERQWKWPCLPEIKKQQMEMSVIDEKPVPLTPSQMFLIIGQDGVDLISMSRRYNVQVWPSTKPFGLRVKGSLVGLRNFTQHIETLKQGIIEETFELPIKIFIKPELVQHISRIAGAHLANGSSTGQIHVSAKSPRSLLIAKRLAIRAACEVQGAEPLLLSYLPSVVPSSTHKPPSIFHHSYSVYPFRSHRSLPWTIGTSSVFRVRRVNEWLDVDSGQDATDVGNLANGKGRVMTMANQSGDILETLFADLPERIGNSERTVAASLGHLLIPSETARKMSLVPPLQGYWQFSKILHWLKTYPMKPTFTPSLPNTLINSAPSKQDIVHRLVYHAVPNIGLKTSSPNRLEKVLKCELILQDSRHSSAAHLVERVAAISNHGDEVLGKSTSRDISHDLDPENNSTLTHIDRSTAGIDTSTNEEFFSFTKRIWTGLETTVDLLMPDRSMDIRFQAFDSSELIGGEEPSEIKDYLVDLERFLTHTDLIEQPDPPLLLTYTGVDYVLHSNTSVRRNSEVVPYSRPDGSSDLIYAVSENVLDLESTQKSSICQLICDDYSSNSAWQKFLHGCDVLAASSSKRAVSSHNKLVELSSA